MEMFLIKPFHYLGELNTESSCQGKQGSQPYLPCTAFQVRDMHHVNAGVLG